MSNNQDIAQMGNNRIGVIRLISILLLLTSCQHYSDKQADAWTWGCQVGQVCCQGYNRECPK